MVFSIPKNVVKGTSRLNFASRSASARNFKSSSSKSLTNYAVGKPGAIENWFSNYNDVAIIPNYLILRWFFLIYCELKVLPVTQDSTIEIGEIL